METENIRPDSILVGPVTDEYAWSKQGLTGRRQRPSSREPIGVRPAVRPDPTHPGPYLVDRALRVLFRFWFAGLVLIGIGTALYSFAHPTLLR